jgi:hypothetical protein
MLFVNSSRGVLANRTRDSRRVWDGTVRGVPDCWVVVARDESDLADWVECEERAVEAAPLRICSAIVEDGVLVLTDRDARERVQDAFRELL